MNLKSCPDCVAQMPAAASLPVVVDPWIEIGV
jgi:hypothetical protein